MKASAFMSGWARKGMATGSLLTVGAAALWACVAIRSGAISPEVWLDSTSQICSIPPEIRTIAVSRRDVEKCIRNRPAGRGDLIHAWRVLVCAELAGVGSVSSPPGSAGWDESARRIGRAWPAQGSTSGFAKAARIARASDSDDPANERLVLEWPTVDEAHPGQFLAAMAEGRVPSSSIIRSPAGEQTVSEMLEAARTDPRFLGAHEFAAVALAVYGPRRTGEGLWGDAMFDRIMEALVHDAESDREACHGTHVLHAIAALLNVHRSTPILGAAAETQGRRRLAHAGRQLVSLQHPDGAWRFDWRRPRVYEAPASELAAWGGDVQITAHHLEWMAYSPENVVPATSIRRALEFLAERVHAADDTDVRRDFCGYTHAVRALLVWGVVIDSQELAPLGVRSADL